MKVLMLHLSDIHIKTSEDAVLLRAPKIADAVKNLDSTVDGIAIVLTGDVTWSGTAEQFSLALQFATSLKDAIQVALPGVRIEFIAIPGNHDCDFSGANDARAVLLKAVMETPSRLKDRSFGDICLAPLTQFFAFRDALDLVPTSTTKQPDKRLYAEYRFEHAGEAISFCCCNTAATSQLHEQPGALIFPWDTIPTTKSNRSCFHWSVPPNQLD